MPIGSFAEQLNVIRRIERCRDCELNKDDHCMHEKVVLNSEEGIRPWIWDVEQCPKGDV